MRVVLPYVKVHPLCEAHLPARTERFHVGHSTIAYWQLLCDLWAAGEAFMVVEHDIELAGDEAASFEACPEPWCTYSYMVAGNRIHESLGCTRFTTQLLAELPGLAVEAGGISGGLPAGDWRRLDVTLAGLLRQHGHQAHVHGQVAHHHVYPATGCACGLTHD